METYIALLRGINVGGQKKIKMAELKTALEASGLQSVTTYIQSGNIVFGSLKKDCEKLASDIAKTILAHFGFEVPTLVVTTAVLEQILLENPFANEEPKSLYFVLLKQVPKAVDILEFNRLKFEHEDFHITEKCVYLCCKAGYGKAKLSNNLVERKLRVEATARNLRTMQKLIEMGKS